MALEALKKKSQAAPNPVVFSDPLDAEAPIRLLIVADNFGPTQQISFVIPLQSWRTAGAAIVRVIDEPSLQHIRDQSGNDAVKAFLKSQFSKVNPTLVIISRYSGADYPAIFELARSHRAPIVFHVDDDLFEMPIGAGIEYYRRYRQPNRVHRLYRIADTSDAIFVSTPALGESVKRRLDPKRVIAAKVYAGAKVNNKVKISRPSDKAEDEIRIGYMGTASHAFDLELAESAIFETLDRFPNVKFHLFGSICSTDIAKNFGSRVVKLPRVDGSYHDFRSVLPTLGWDIGLAPLRQSEFNACKAPTKWVEYSEAGIPVIASKNSVYGVLSQHDALELCDDDQWAAAIAKLVTQPQRRAELVRHAQGLLASDFAWTRVEDQVVDLVATMTPPLLAPA